MHDSGGRQAFNTGAVRDTAAGKPRIELISPVFLQRVQWGLDTGWDTPRVCALVGWEDVADQLWKAQEDPRIGDFCDVAVNTAACIDPENLYDRHKRLWLSPKVAARLGDWLAKGAEKYSARNWEAGIPIERSLASAHRHLNEARRLALGGTPVEGDTDDHPIAVLCNLMFIIHTMVMCDRGILPAGLAKLPSYSISTPQLPAAGDPAGKAKLDLRLAVCQSPST